MAPLPVEWALVVYYGSEAHRAAYGRQVHSDRYTKDYIQLSRKREFLETVKRLFAVNSGETASVPLTYLWPTGQTHGAFVLRSSDRPHLKWETSSGAPQVWKMSLAPSETSSETIPGDPSHVDYAAAERERALLASRGAGQPYLMAIKLRDHPRSLHLRVYLGSPGREYEWANLQLAPQSIQALAQKTSQRSALAWSVFQSGGTALSAGARDALSRLARSANRESVIEALDNDTGRALAEYLKTPGYGLFFDPARNHDAWLLPDRIPEPITGSIRDIVQMLEARYPAPELGDAAAEKCEFSAHEVDTYRRQITQDSYAVADSHATVRTRGSAQKAFAEAVKANYGSRCAITNINTADFLVASHIVPWSEDQSIRLDPSNGICLSLLVDRAFERGYLIVQDDLTICIDWDKIGDDQALRSQLGPYDGQQLNAPTEKQPNPEYLRRRRTLVTPRE